MPVPILLVRSVDRGWSVRLVSDGTLFGDELTGQEAARCRSRPEAQRWALDRLDGRVGVVVTPQRRTFLVECSEHGVLTKSQTTEAYAVQRAREHLAQHHAEAGAVAGPDAG